MVRSFASATLLVLFLLGASGCTLIANLSTPTATLLPTLAPSPTPPPIPTSAPAVASPTPFPLPLLPTIPPATAVPAIAAPILPTPEFDFADLSPYRQAMLPQFVTDVDTVAAAGASRYYLEVELKLPEGDSSNPHLKGVARVRYTNTEQMPLSEIYFRLYPNLPG
ncbi:MAG: hypothetical protein HYR94_19850, partial [Chloroflexi bacterium]|nr:hypothetical protein [Chloroflexota bacterium]